MPNLDWWMQTAPDLYVDRIDHKSEVWPYKNGSGSTINAGAPCCLLVSGFDGVLASIPDATNMGLFRGVWLGTLINGVLSNIPNGAYGLVQQWGLVQDLSGVGAARVLGSSTGGPGNTGINASGRLLRYSAGNDYFDIFNDLFSDGEEMAWKVVSGEAWTTVSTALKKVWLKG